MKRSLEWLDGLAATNVESSRARWLERIGFAFLILMVVSAPHSIAATQTAWLIGLFVTFIRLFIKPRPRFRFTPLDAALWAFFAWSAVTSFTSYAPDISIDKLRGVIVFLIFYFVVLNLRSLRAVHFLAFALIASCMVNVLWTPVQRLIGRGVEIHGLAPDGPLTKALLTEGDTLLAANGKKITTPEEVLAEVEKNEITKIKFYRPDFEYSVDVKRSDLLAGSTVLERLGVSNWNKSSNWRSSGFYGHYTTYAEVLQLIASLVLGLVVAFITTRKRESAGRQNSQSPPLPFSPTPLLITALAAICLALLLTVTRASQLAFLISALVIVLIGGGRKMLFAAVVVLVPIAFAGLLFLQQSRHVGFFDAADDSIKWRQTVWREGIDLWTDGPRNFIFGVGMDSIKRYKEEWHLFDDGRLPVGHFHSTPMNLVVERGLPALLLWLAILGIYARTLWRGIRPNTEDPVSFGILLGCLGGTVGFFASGLVHYNLGDQEVAMVFFILMALGVFIANREHFERGDRFS